MSTSSLQHLLLLISHLDFQPGLGLQVTRDHLLRDFEIQEGVDVARQFGSGYPAGDASVQLMTAKFMHCMDAGLRLSFRAYSLPNLAAEDLAGMHRRQSLLI